MTNRRAVRPMNRDAVSKANQEFYATHSEMLVNGKRQSLSADDPAFAAKRKEWMDAYVRNGGKAEAIDASHVRKARKDVEQSFSDKPVGTAVAACPNAPPTKAATQAIRKPTPTPPLPPPSSPLVAAVKAPPVCELLDVTLTCEHGRSPGPEGILMVVPNSTASIGDKVAGQIRVKGGCGDHPAWTVGGAWISVGKGATFDFNAKTFAPSVLGFFSLEKVTPHTYQVQASSCAGGPRVFEVQGYPPGKVGAKLDVSKIIDDIHQALKHLPVAEEESEKWTDNWFRGSIEYEGAWKEDNTWRVFYEKSVVGKFDPLVGISYKGPVYPLTLVPGWLAKWVRAGLFYEVKFGAKFQCGFKGKYWPNTGISAWHEKTVMGGGSGGGALSLELALCPDVVEGAVVGESGLGLEVTGTSGDEAKVELVIKFDGLKGKASIKLAWGWVELTREFQLLQERELYKKEWLLTEDK